MKIILVVKCVVTISMYSCLQYINVFMSSMGLEAFLLHLP